jgi:hypothetical protein
MTVSTIIYVPFGLPHESVSGLPLFSVISSTLSSDTETDGIIIDQYSEDISARQTFELLSGNSKQITTIASLSSWANRAENWFTR